MTGPASRGASVAAFAVPFLMLAPLAGKAFHIDDTHFLRMAQHLQSAPLDYFGYAISWNGYRGPGFDTNFNPPGVGYLLAAAGWIAGWRETPLHLIFAAIAGLTCLGIYRLAHRLTPNPFAAAAITALTPGFLVSGSTLMSDVPALCLYVWALHCWIEGIERDRRSLLLAGATLIGFAALTKYFGITAVPLAAAYAIAQRRKPGFWCAALTVPLFMIGIYGAHTRAAYGRDHLQYAGEFARYTRAALAHSYAERVATVVPYFGAAALSWAFFIPALAARRGRVGAGVGLAAMVALGAAAGFSGSVAEFYGAESGGAQLYGALVGAGAAVGLAGIFVAVRELFAQRDAGTLLLGLWLIGTLVYALAVAPVLGVRVILPAIPALGILFSRGLSEVDANQPARRSRLAVCWAASVALAFVILVADYTAAERDRNAAASLHEQARLIGGPLYYWGPWGFAYYMEEGGAQALIPRALPDGGKTFPLSKGMLIAVPQMYEPIVIPPELAEVAGVWVARESWPVATWDARARAGFYGEFLGRLPFSFCAPREHRFVIYRVTAGA